MIFCKFPPLGVKVERRAHGVDFNIWGSTGHGVCAAEIGAEEVGMA